MVGTERLKVCSNCRAKYYRKMFECPVCGFPNEEIQEEIDLAKEQDRWMIAG